MFGFGRRTEELVPEGQGLGPSYAAPDPFRSGPYIGAGYGYAPVNAPIEQQWQDNNHYDSPPPEAPEEWGKYHNHRTAAYPEEQSHSIPSVAMVDQQSRAADPRWNPPLPSRQITAPSTYRFHRRFDQERAHHLDGNHFSMASHERTYDIGGMAPARERGRRNTYRLEPGPWDEHIVDRTVSPVPVSDTYVMPESEGGTRSWRL